MMTRAGRAIAGHKIRWFVYAWDHEGRRAKLPKTAKMTAGWFAFDAECECGWASQTGGATKASVERDVLGHKIDVTEDILSLFAGSRARRISAP